MGTGIKMRRNNPSDLTQTRSVSAIVNRRDLHAHVLTYQRPIRELRFPGIIEDEGLFVSTTLKRGFLKRGTVSRTRRGGGERRKGERGREREDAVRLGSSNEYNQNGLVEKQPRAIPLLVYTEIGRAHV